MTKSMLLENDIHAVIIEKLKIFDSWTILAWQNLGIRNTSQKMELKF